MPIKLDQVLEILKALAQAEYAVKVLYKCCATKWPDDKDFWLHLAREEEKHVKNIEKIMAIISEKPKLFEVGRSFNVVAINTFLEGILSSINRIKTQDVTKQSMLFIARDIENSVIESKYAEITKTRDVEFLALAKEIDEDTLKHKALIARKIREVTANE